MQFRWVTAELTGSYPVAFIAPWESNDPDYGLPGCVSIRADGTIGDQDCTSNPVGYLCECDEYPDLIENR